MTQSDSSSPTGPNDHDYILDTLILEFQELFEAKSLDYGDDANRLGPKGAFVDIYRKTGKLKRAIWDGQEMRGEQPREILFDLIGHCFLTISSLDSPREQM